MDRVRTRLNGPGFVFWRVEKKTGSETLPAYFFLSTPLIGVTRPHTPSGCIG
ncbi:hypothetical protein [Spirosoma pollinicola]|uniref:hypothetical protein n=1 Tax=Spirosoma pollinicola TaxID=2057025 RepID=UPI0012FDEF21|nr:hypothetical protein [Spirosoma pollinicola]